jgi:glyoxylase-like metal-dependent hydrolase (beta-lactamase superfamily II)
MPLQIIPFENSINTAYIIKDQGAVLFDASYMGASKPFEKLLSDSGIEPDEIKLIIISHADFDHAGGAKELQELTGAKIVMHKKECKYLEESVYRWPGGVTAWGKFSRAVFQPVVKSKVNFPPAKVDIPLGDEGLALYDYGIQGKVIHTPGHTGGSISLVLDTGEAFIGCMAHNRFPFVLRPSLPIYAEDVEGIKQSWKLVIDQGAHTIYPGHGKPFPLEKIEKYLN